MSNKDLEQDFIMKVRVVGRTIEIRSDDGETTIRMTVRAAEQLAWMIPLYVREAKYADPAYRKSLRDRIWDWFHDIDKDPLELRKWTVRFFIESFLIAVVVSYCTVKVLQLIPQR